MISALILDIDGTLVDSNGLHARAWCRALEEYGYRVPEERILGEIGKGGDKLVPSLLGPTAEDRHGESLRQAQGEEFRRIARSETIPLRDGARALLETIRKQTLLSAIATSSGRENVEAIEKSCGLRFTELVDHVVTADDAEQSKPSPDLIRAACRALDRTPAACAMIGDTIFDAEACRRAGVALLGVESGLATPAEMTAAGARRTWPSPAHLVAAFDDALLIASPLAVELSQSRIEEIMGAALEAAERGMACGEAPIGCAVADREGRIVATGHNRERGSGHPIDHAELVTLGSAFDRLPRGAADLILACTLEPCVMCTGAAMVGGVDVILYGLQAPADSGTRRVRAPESPGSRMPRIVGEVFADRSRALFEMWLREHATPEQEPYVRQLLERSDNQENGTEGGETKTERMDERRVRE